MSGDVWPAELLTEHGVLLRHWAGLQTRLSRQCHEQAHRCAALEAELMRQRARWLLATTQALWGLGWPVGAPLRNEPGRARPAQDTAQRHAGVDAVLCQTGCSGHAHPWRGDEGQCRLTGGDCSRVPPSSTPQRVQATQTER